MVLKRKIDRGVSLARAVLMVTPTHFSANAETAQDNSFMPAPHSEEDDKTRTYCARAEFDSVVAALREVGVDVRAHMQQSPELVDSLFPNNWLSTHKAEQDSGGLVVTYPMRYPSRQAEKNLAIVSDLMQCGKYAEYVEFDAMGSGKEWVLEGTGALVFDRRFRRIYAGISQRCTRQAVARFHEEFNRHYTDEDWDLVVFPIANPSTGVPIYHTNVVMAVLPQHIVLCSAAIPDLALREHVVSLVRTDYGADGLIDLSFEEVEQMCGNMLAVASDHEHDKACVLMSARARKGLREGNWERIAAAYRVITVDVSTIEHFSGGSIRCMMAEIF
eukprot:GEMP01042454.1.p1 GENE.GEMP01042454.1~~GEMP01042454.1.p1  ORF type:complete len:331 (+),score=76.10 GEMP01042454.1:135-1127(+)